MGKHTARDDSTVDPLVADALARRGDAPLPVHGEHSSGSTGWPEPARVGGGAVGWPEDTGPAPDGAPQDAADSSADEPPGGVERTADGALPPAHLAVRRGWRRLFGASPAA